MTPNQIDNSSYTNERRPWVKHRYKFLLGLLILVIACDFLGQYLYHCSLTRREHRKPDATLVTFVGPAGAYHLQYDPTVFQHVPAPNVETFIAKGGHASFTVSTARNVQGFASIFEQDEDYYRGLVLPVFITDHALRFDDFSISANTLHLVDNQHFFEIAYKREADYVVNKLCIHYDSECDRACLVSLRHTSVSFFNSSPH
jgi:hypothetical protein